MSLLPQAEQAHIALDQSVDCISAASEPRSRYRIDGSRYRATYIKMPLADGDERPRAYARA